MGFRFRPLAIPDVILIEAETHADDRGFFRETFKRTAFEVGGIDRDFVQSNMSRSRAGALRGLHFQRDPAAVAKLVGAAAGRLFDVAADVRPGSPTFGLWVGEELSVQNGRMLYVPEGFAHGFVALEDDTVATYLMTGEFSPEHDAGVRWNDPDIGVDWPIEDPILSPKDEALPFLHETAATAEEARA